MKIRTFGDSGRQRECERRLTLNKCVSRYEGLVLLPIPTSRDGEHITGTDSTFLDVAKEVVPNTLVVGYNIPDALGELLCDAGAEIYDAGLDERFLTENADITARGALGRILCEFPKDMTDMNIGIIGYGRIGKRLLRLLLFLGASVTVYTRKEETRLELSGVGIPTKIFSPECDLSQLDLVVNTAPARLLGAEKIKRLAADAKIMDLASGNNFPNLPRVIKLASVPDSMYPLTAGRIYAKYIAEYLYDEGESDLT